MILVWFCHGSSMNVALCYCVRMVLCFDVMFLPCCYIGGGKLICRWFNLIVLV